MATVAQCLALGLASTPFSSQGKRVVSSSSSSPDRQHSLVSSRDEYIAFGCSRVSLPIMRAIMQPKARKLAPAASTHTLADARVAIPDVLEQLVQGIHLTRKQSETVMDTFLDQANPALISAFLALLRKKGETVEELTGVGKAMLRRCPPMKGMTGALDIVGTGGDGANTVNISTGSAILAAACGAKVAKSGCRKFSSACGSADVLQELGVAINLGPRGVVKCVNELGIGFMLTNSYDPATWRLDQVERAMKMKTALNVLGPILNPARVPYAIVGVHSQNHMMRMASILQEFAVERALVVHSEGLDEMTPVGGGVVLEVTPNKISRFTFDPLEFGIPPCTVNDLKGGNATFNAKILRNVLAGEEGHIANALILNAGAGLMACGIAKNLQDGVALAREVQRSGKANDLLDSWIAFSWKQYRCEMLDNLM